MESNIEHGRHVVWEPQKRQREALMRTENEVLYGGARGGGKTDAGLAWLLFDSMEKKYRALVIRRNADDLRDWIDRARSFYEPAHVWIQGQPAEIFFPSGAIIRTGHLKDENAYSKYQGHEYQKILIEELTHIPREDDYEKLLGSNRSTVPGIFPQVFATTNPDGAGYSWVKERWCIPDEPTEIIVTKRGNRSLCFIPARVEDNPKLTEADPAYVAYLESIKDEDLRRAWREGSWAGTHIKGSIYGEELQRMRQEGRIGNVGHDDGLLVDTVWDLGMGDSTAIGFFQSYGRQYRMIDYYENSGQGVSHYIRVLDEKKKTHRYLYGKHYAPHDILVRELGTGKTRYETARSLGLTFEIRMAKARRDGSIKAKSAIPNIAVQDGIDKAKEKMGLLWIDAKKCELFLTSLEQYRREYNEKMREYSVSPLHDWTSHAADMLRYWALIPEEEERVIRQYRPKIERF